MSVIELAVAQLVRPHTIKPGLHGFAMSSRPPIPPKIRLGSPGTPSNQPTLLTVISDDSGSLAGPEGNDPISGRYREARLAFESVARAGAGLEELGAVIHFDTPTSGDVPPTRLDRRGVHTLSKGLRRPPDARGTSVLLPSLEVAHLLASTHPDHRPILVVLSDFELFEDNVDHTLRRLTDFPGDVQAVVLGSGGPTDADFSPESTVTRVSPDDPPGAVARAVFESLTKYRRF